jgi:hypothetical protein
LRINEGRFASQSRALQARSQRDFGNEDGLDSN